LTENFYSSKNYLSFPKEVFMRELFNSEINQISGGLNCIDPKTYKNMQNMAWGQASLYGIIVSVFSGAVAFGITSNPITAAVAVAALAPYGVGYGYFNSSVWNTFLSE
jgi:hypothetical protein